MAKQRNWGSALAMLAFAGFIATSLWAKWNPASAQDTPKSAVQAKPADAAHAKDAKGKAALAKSFNDNKPLDKMVSEILTSTGTLADNGAVGYFVGNPTVDKMTDNVAKMFLGVRLECAQCHNHPFVSWKQEEYWGMAAFFMK